LKVDAKATNKTLISVYLYELMYFKRENWLNFDR